MSTSPPFHLLLAITGASGACYPARLLEKLSCQTDINLSIVMTKNAREVWEYEWAKPLPQAPQWCYWDVNDFSAPFASGSNPADSMLVLPCSMGALARMAHGISDNLITRAADVQLKEGRPLVLVPRESPYSLIHLQNMTLLAQAGATIAPASPPFYHHPQDINSLIDTFIDRLLFLCGATKKYGGYRWEPNTPL
ncbi:MAG: UbiX family flavin prenyltransferase [Bacteroidales bacterium]|nr:UbiX family flavin prenyltransferase [Bacteroidales bacterium]